MDQLLALITIAAGPMCIQNNIRKVDKCSPVFDCHLGYKLPNSIGSEAQVYAFTLLTKPVHMKTSKPLVGK